MSELGAETGLEDGFFRLVGRDIFRAFWYNPQALHIVDPLGDRRQRGVCVVLQLLNAKISLVQMFCCICISLSRTLTCKLAPALASQLSDNSVRLPAHL